MTNQKRDEAAEAFVLDIQWYGEDYGARKRYYVDCFKAGYSQGQADMLEEMEAHLEKNQIDCPEWRYAWYFFQSYRNEK